MQQKSSNTTVITCRMCLTKNRRTKYLCINDSQVLRSKFERCFGSKVYRKPQKSTYLCDDCVVSIDSFLELQRAARRNDKVYFERLRTRYNCDLCGHCYYNKFFIRKHMEKYHLKPFLWCDYCGKKFASKNQRDQHAKCIHKYQCKVCKKKFLNRKNLNRHIRSYHHRE